MTRLATWEPTRRWDENIGMVLECKVVYWFFLAQIGSFSKEGSCEDGNAPLGFLKG